MSNTQIVKVGVITEIHGHEERYIVWSQTWDGTLYFECGTSWITSHFDALERARDAMKAQETVDNGCWIKGSLG